MKNFKLISLIILSSIFLVACAADGEPDQPAEELIKEAVDNMSKVKSASYNISLDGTINDEDPLSLFKEIDFNGNFSGQYDFNDLKDPNFSLLVEIIASLDGGNDENINAEFRITDNNLYFSLADISDINGELPIELITPFLSKWWFIPIPEENLEAIEFYTDENETNLTEEQKKVKALLKDAFMFENVEYQGDEKIKGVKSYYYTADLDEKAIKDYLLESAEIMGETTSASDIEQIDSFLSNLDLNLGLWISKGEKTLIQVSADASIEEPGYVSLDLELTYTLSDVNEKVKLEAPENAEMLDVLSMLGGAAALVPEEDLYSNPYGDDFTFDESAYGDDILFEEFSEEADPEEISDLYEPTLSY